MTPEQKSMVRDLLDGRCMPLSDWAEWFVFTLNERQDKPLTEWQSSQLRCLYRDVSGYSVISQSPASRSETPIQAQ